MNPQRIIINSVPKSGTHLVLRGLELLGASTRPPLPLSSAQPGWVAADRDEPAVPIGVGMPVMAPVRMLRMRLEAMPAGQVVTGHVPWSAGMAVLLEELGFCMLLALRDPRDVAVSLAHHIATQPGHRLHAQFAALTSQERITRTICGTEGLESLQRRVAMVLPWRKYPHVLPVSFEALVGVRGGGDDAAQQRTLAAIAAHLGADPAGLGTVAQNLFGTSATFRRGMIGAWRTELTAEQVRLASPAVELYSSLIG